MTSEEIIDLQALSERIGDDVDLIGEIVPIFLDRYPESIDKVRRAVV